MTTVFVDLGNTKLELLRPLGAHSPIAGFLEKKPEGGMHVRVRACVFLYLSRECG